MSAQKETYNKLDISKLKTRKHRIISSTEALKDVTPMEWSNDVVSGKKIVKITKA